MSTRLTNTLNLVLPEELSRKCFLGFNLCCRRAVFNLSLNLRFTYLGRCENNLESLVKTRFLLPELIDSKAINSFQYLVGFKSFKKTEGI